MRIHLKLLISAFFLQLSAFSLSAAPAAFLDRLTATLTDHYRPEGQLTLELTRPLLPPAGSYEITVLETPATLSSLLVVRVRLTPEKTPATEHSLALRAQHLVDAWALRAPADRDQAIDLAQLEPRRTDTLRDRDAVPVSADLAQLTFARNIPTARLLNWSDLSRRLLIRKGQLVEVTATDGQLAITMKALALENATAGSTVKVRNLESRKDFTAHVTAENRALVRF